MLGLHRLPPQPGQRPGGVRQIRASARPPDTAACTSPCEPGVDFIARSDRLSRSGTPSSSAAPRSVRTAFSVVHDGQMHAGRVGERGDHAGGVDQRLGVDGHHGPGGAERHHRVARARCRARRPPPWSRRSRRRSAAPPGSCPAASDGPEHLGQHAPGARAPARRDPAGRRRSPPTSSRSRRRRRGPWSGAPAARAAATPASRAPAAARRSRGARVRLRPAPASAAWSPAARPAARSPRPAPTPHARRARRSDRRPRPAPACRRRPSRGARCCPARPAGPARSAAPTRRWPARPRAARRSAASPEGQQPGLRIDVGGTPAAVGTSTGCGAYPCLSTAPVSVSQTTMRVKSGELSNPATIPMAQILPYAVGTPTVGRRSRQVLLVPQSSSAAVRGALAQGADPLGDRVGHAVADLLAHRVVAPCPRTRGPAGPRSRRCCAPPGSARADARTSSAARTARARPACRARNPGQSGDEREPVAHGGHPFSCVGPGVSASSTRAAEIIRRGRYRLAEHPPACANVCVAASARPLANTQAGAFDATRAFLCSSIGRAAGC